MIPGEYLLAEGDVIANAGRREIELEVANTGDRPIQVGSHFHFFEVNRALQFDRAARTCTSGKSFEVLHPLDVFEILHLLKR